MAEIFRDRQRAESFGTDAERYERTRPSYPIELIDWLTDSSPGFAVDVGCGTGQVARLLATAGWNVVGVEVDERMAAVARRHGLEVDVSAFEQWRPIRDSFDLVCSGQAWHWIDPDVGYRKAAELLRPGGRLALFWNAYEYDSDVMDVFAEVFGRHAPDLLTDSVLFGTANADHADVDAAAIRRSGCSFGEAESRVFFHERIQSVEQWLDEAVTHSPVAILSDEVRDAAFADVVPRLVALTGGDIRIRYKTRVTSVRTTF